ncbi:MAG: anthranilate synthase component I family protein [Elusimicrobia bacterium]|nr:anthranilate synthase component I family protein [Elusimicrobiota bacterium]
MSARLGVERFPLGPADFDGPAALEAAGAARGFLLEKTGPAGHTAVLGASPFETLRIKSGRLVSETARGAKTLPGNPFWALGKRLAQLRARGAAPFETGAVGYLDYEIVRHLERLPPKAWPEEALMMLCDGLVVADRAKGAAQFVALVEGPSGRRRARRCAERWAGILRRTPRRRNDVSAPPKTLAPIRPTMGKSAFMAAVRRLKEHIRAGDIFQAVLSETFHVNTKASPALLCRTLGALGAPPYLFWLKDGVRHLIGASPERLVKVENGVALNCPIAGTRPRGADRRADLNFERALKRSPKERAEHLMLVDLGRNDLGRVCAPGTVKVNELMRVRRHPNVMHLVSEVEGRLEQGRTPWEALAASFPAGTVSGAPKVRAMELLSGLEPRPRGFYAGAVLQHDFSGNLDSCITIRAMGLQNGVARLQAGAGIVADSNPAREYEEILNKLLSLRRALALAELK